MIKYCACGDEENDDAHGHSHGDGGHGHSHGGDDDHGHAHAHGDSDETDSYHLSVNNTQDHGHSHGANGHSHSHGGDHKIAIRTNRNSTSRNRSYPRSPTSARSPKSSCGGLGPLKAADKRLLDDEDGPLHSAPSEEEAENEKARRKLWTASVLCFCFMIAEIIGGFFANSLAIMTDAAHLLSDLAGFLISIFALWLATRAPTSRLSFGFHRAEILGALISVLLIWLLTGILVYEAIFRIRNPEEVDGKLMFIVASTGLGVNLLMGFILHQSGHGHSHGLGGGHGHSHGGHGSHEEEEEDDEHGSHGGHGGHGRSGKNINVTAAFVHVVGDALQSVGVMIAAGLIWYNPEWRIADPITTFVFSLLVLFTTTRLIKQSIGVLMEGVPEGIDPEAVESALSQVRGVAEVHDLHIWSLSVGKPSLSVHLLTKPTDEASEVLAAAHQLCARRFNIHHSTIQVERLQDQITCNVGMYE